MSSFYHDLAADAGTPYWLYDEAVLQRRLSNIAWLTEGPGLQPRFAMKACPATRVLAAMRSHGLWIDAVSGNEVLRARHAGFAGGNDPPQILFTSDAWRDNALAVIQQERILPNLGSPGMVEMLRQAGYRGPIALRVNPGFGHGHVNTCDTGGPSAKHGIWYEDLPAVAGAAAAAGLRVVMLHAHIGSGPQPAELLHNWQRLAAAFETLLPLFPEATAVNLGGGLPFDYRAAEGREAWLPDLRDLLVQIAGRLARAAGQAGLRVEIEPGRYLMAPVGTLVTRVLDVKRTRGDARGPGVTFVMVDAGFNDLLRPALYGAYHALQVLRGEADEPVTGEVAPVVVAGPLCEAGDVFTREANGLLAPRSLPCPQPGDLLLIHDVGAYGYAMSSTYNSFGPAPQFWRTSGGEVQMMSRRGTLADLLRLETG